MKLHKLYVRFYKAFNYDYLRKSRGGGDDPWDVLDETDARVFPFVIIPIEPDITTVVGANEAGKTQVISAIECLLTGKKILSRDFCRYSDLLTVDKDMSVPEFGGEFRDLSDGDRKSVLSALGANQTTAIDGFWLFRLNKRNVIYARVPDEDGELKWLSKTIADAKLKQLALPTITRIRADVPLPDSIPLDYLTESSSKRRARSRKSRLELIGRMLDPSGWLSSTQKLTEAVPDVIARYGNYDSAIDDERLLLSLSLAERLIFTVAGISRDTVKKLTEAVQSGDDGWANGLVKDMNFKLNDALNFQKWWSQDAEFRVVLSLRDFDLVLTVQDRTGQEYSFAERSSGMSYFLSYFVQYLSHERVDTQQILLMDEPDTFLSMQGQQDLLAIFGDFAHPENTEERDPVQVLYVTHSPFLIDKNHSERIRVLQKGEGDEGTRVVANAGRNHYEPLRSALGAFVAETAFISNCNLMLEGQADQVLLTGMSSLSRRYGATGQTLDLNTLTLVPAGGAQHVPYMVYLALGRDVDRPAVTVLLDSDEGGEAAAKELHKGYRGKQLVEDRFVVRIGDLKPDQIKVSVPKPIELEDLIPAAAFRLGVLEFAEEVLAHDEAQALAKKLGTITPKSGETLFKAAERLIAKATPDGERVLDLDKVGVARGVIAVLDRPEKAEDRSQAIQNFAALFALLERARRDSLRKQASDRSRRNVKDLKIRFRRDHPNSATRRAGRQLLDDMFDLMPNDSLASQKAHKNVGEAIAQVTMQFELEKDPVHPIDNYEDFLGQLDKIVYQDLYDAQEAPPQSQSQTSTRRTNS